MNSITPIFPCQSLDELIEFYQLLGFTVTYRQKSPNPYAVVERNWIRLDFYGMKDHVPNRCFHTCYITAEDTDELYERFTAALRKKSGKLPTRGLPRISELRDKTYGVREFQLTDIAGNYIKIGRPIGKTEEEQYSEEMAAASNRLSLALNYAYRWEDDEGELETVAKTLDKAIARDRQQLCRNLLKVMNLRADVAIAQGDMALARQLLQTVQDNPLVKGDPGLFRTEVQRAADIAQKINSETE